MNRTQYMFQAARRLFDSQHRSYPLPVGDYAQLCTITANGGRQVHVLYNGLLERRRSRGRTACRQETPSLAMTVADQSFETASAGIDF